MHGFLLWSIRFLLKFLHYDYRSFETVAPKEAPLVLEITSVLREWGAIWKNLYIVSITLEYSI